MPVSAVAPIEGKTPLTTEIDPSRLAEVREGFGRRGESVGSWARRHGFSRFVVHDVLNGRRKATRGVSHQVAVLLGLKDGEIENIETAPKPDVGSSATVSASNRPVTCDRIGLSQEAAGS